MGHITYLNILNVYINMAKTMTVSEEAYERLASKKEPGESFSEVIIKLTGKANLMDLAGVLSRAEASDLRKAISLGRERMRKGMREL